MTNRTNIIVVIKMMACISCRMALYGTIANVVLGDLDKKLELLIASKRREQT